MRRWLHIVHRDATRCQTTRLDTSAPEDVGSVYKLTQRWACLGVAIETRRGAGSEAQVLEVLSYVPLWFA
jgi:hypothetical protein